MISACFNKYRRGATWLTCIPDIVELRKLLSKEVVIPPFLFKAWLVPNNKRSIIIEDSPPPVPPAEVYPDIAVCFIDWAGAVALVAYMVFWAD